MLVEQLERCEFAKHAPPSRLPVNMDVDGFEDLLFDDPFSQLSGEEDYSERSEDELLFADTDDEPTLWDMHDCSPPQQSQTEPEHDIRLGSKDSNLTLGDTHGVHGQTVACDRYWVIARIEAILESIVDSLLEGRESLTITLKSRAAISRRLTKRADGDAQIRIPQPKFRNISFPGATAKEAWNFTVLLRLLELIHGGLLDNICMTKRDIYYRHPDLFVKQSVVDRYVDELACTLGITRSQLNVAAASKGLVAGNFSLTREHGYHVHCINEIEGMMVPNLSDKDALDLTCVRWILVIEKEATFRLLISSAEWQSLRSNGIVLTAKGYPDLASRKFLRQVMDHDSSILAYALVDWDPDGIAILSTYKYGSYRLAHEDLAQKNAPALGLPRLRWLGINSQNLSRTLEGEDLADPNPTPHLQGLMKLTPRDRNKATRMLEWDLCDTEGPEQAWRQELQLMLMLNVKAEMQILDEMQGGLVSWLSKELDQVTEKVCGEQVEDSSSDEAMLF